MEKGNTVSNFSYVELLTSVDLHLVSHRQHYNQEFSQVHKSGY